MTKPSEVTPARRTGNIRRVKTKRRYHDRRGGVPLQDLAALWTHGEAGAREHLRNTIEAGEPFRARDRLALAYLLVHTKHFVHTSKARLDADGTAEPLTEIAAVYPDDGRCIGFPHQVVEYIARPKK